jgi:hypothetical protein
VTTVQSSRQPAEELQLGDTGGGREEKKRERMGREVSGRSRELAPAGKDELERARGRRRNYLRGE